MADERLGYLRDARTWRQDRLSPPGRALRIERELAGPCTTIVQPDAVHVGNNVRYESRALLADWLRQTLD